MKKAVYLAGPITGLNYEECTDWRQYFIDMLPEIDCYSPMRCKDYLLNETKITDVYSESLLSNQRSIFARDLNDCRTCDLLLVNLLGSEKVSIGTMMEIGACAALGTPIVLIMEPGNIHDHSMVREACAFRPTSLDEACVTIKSILLPGSHVK